MVAVRTWAAPGMSISHGLLDRVEAGTADDIADRMALAISRKWDQQIIAEMVLVFLFLSVAVPRRNPLSGAAPSFGIHVAGLDVPGRCPDRDAWNCRHWLALVPTEVFMVV